jgi:hypothetical protein
VAPLTLDALESWVDYPDLGVISWKKPWTLLMLNLGTFAMPVLTIDLSHRKPTGFVSVPREWPQMQVKKMGAAPPAQSYGTQANTPYCSGVESGHSWPVGTIDHRAGGGVEWRFVFGGAVSGVGSIRKTTKQTVGNKPCPSSPPFLMACGPDGPTAGTEVFFR